MGPQQLEELTLTGNAKPGELLALEPLDQVVLVGGGAVRERGSMFVAREPIERRQADTVGLRPLGVLARQRTVDVVDHAERGRIRPVVARREHPLEDRGGGPRLGGIERDERHQRSLARSPPSNDSASDSAGMLSASPGTVTAHAPQALPSARQPAESHPRSRPARNPATNASPAPTVSTVLTSWPSAWVTPAGSTANAP